MIALLLFTKAEKHYPAEPAEISHIIADDHYCDIFLVKEKVKFTEHQCLQYYINKLSKSGLFVAVGRSMLINRKQIENFDRLFIYMKNGIQIQMEEAEYHALCKALS